MSNNDAEHPIVIHGGGIAGALLAKSLSRDFRVTLVDPNEYFEVPMATPRNLVNPDFADAAIIPFADALPNVRHIRGTLVELCPDASLVVTSDGLQQRIESRITVLATGSSFSNPLMRAIGGSSVAERKMFYQQYHQRIVAASRILVVGGGPIGVEVVGEITERYPDKTVVIVEAGPRLLAGTSPTAAAYATQVLKQRGVTVVTDERLVQAGSPRADAFAAGGEAVTDQGRRIAYDLLIWCTGGQPNTGYMRAQLASALNDAGRVRVMPDLRVVGSPSIFALGDITDLDENKMAWHIDSQVETAAHNIRALLTGGDLSARLKVHKAQTGNPKMAVTLGSRSGVVHLPVIGVIRSAWFSRLAKAGHMLVPRYRKALGV